VIRLALTGSIGMGKSTVAEMFERAGVPLFDADAVVRDLQANDPNLIAAIGRAVPGTVTRGFSIATCSARAVLGLSGGAPALGGPRPSARPAARTRFIRDNSDALALLFDIPLLFETGGEKVFDKVIVVSAPQRVQARTRARAARHDEGEIRCDPRTSDA
jgi:dephospho-CoA kinase